MKRKQIFIAIGLFSLLTFLLHIFTNIFAGYGIFRDELYYIACSKRIDAGYVDQPPFSIIILWISRSVIGDSIFAIRLIPAIFSALTVFITGLISARLGGKLYGVSLACTAITFAPIYIAMNSIYSMNTFDYFFWALACWLIIRYLDNDQKYLWYFIGLIIGLGLLNKISFLWFAAGLFIGLLLTRPAELRRKEPYFAALIALIIFTPFIIWNITHDFAHLEFISNATTYKYQGITRIDFVMGQFLLMNPFSVPVWFAGIYFLLFDKDGRKYRIAGIIFLVAFLILLINGKSKAEYLGPAYPVLFAGGGVLLERLLTSARLYFFRYLIPVLITISGFIFMPVVLPVLPVETFIEYSQLLGISHGNPESKELNELPQFYADMFGWEEMAKTVSGVYQKLNPEEQKRTVVFAHNYGEAGAIEYFSKKYPLPPVVSPHNNFWYWIDEAGSFDIVLVIGGDKEDHIASCKSVEESDVIRSRYSMPYENNIPVYICRELKKTLNQIWNESKSFI